MSSRTTARPVSGQQHSRNTFDDQRDLSGWTEVGEGTVTANARRSLVIVLLLVVGVLAAAALFVHSAPTHEDAHAAPAARPASAQDSAPPAWCSYPDSAGVTALMDEVDRHVDTIARYSPGQPVDRLTLQLDLMTQCATDGEAAR